MQTTPKFYTDLDYESCPIADPTLDRHWIPTPHRRNQWEVMKKHADDEKAVYRALDATSAIVNGGRWAAAILFCGHQRFE